ncbi:MAG: hypothetical protein JSS94_03545 [Bacteroidetes bacterium]|nr:hypothetical protein [Bacteroidota bacterium]
MKIKSTMLLLIGATTIIACNSKEKEELLKLREKELQEKEELFSKKEADYKALLKMKDSIFAKKDSVAIQVWPKDIEGIWSGKSICSESGCSEYIIGDNRIENWEFGSDSLKLYAISTHNKSIKLFNAEYKNDEILLDYKTDSTAKRKMQINVTLNELSANKMKGTAVVTLDEKCNAKFNVEFNRPSK